MRTNCDLRRIERYFAGQCSPEEETRIQEHLAGCEACRTYLGVLRRTAASLEKEERISPVSRWRILVRSHAFRIAAAFVLVTTVGISYYTLIRPKESQILPGRIQQDVFSRDTYGDEAPVYYMPADTVETVPADSASALPADPEVSRER